jgi:hypothetical protein
LATYAHSSNEALMCTVNCKKKGSEIVNKEEKRKERKKGKI